MKTYNLLAYPGGVDLKGMFDLCFKVFEEKAPDVANKVRNFLQSYKPGGLRAINNENFDTLEVQQILLMCGVIICYIESGYDPDAGSESKDPKRALGYFQMKYGVLPERTRQEIYSHRDDFVYQWKHSYYEPLRFWLRSGKYKLTSILQILAMNHLPGYALTMMSNTNTKFFIHDAQSWRSKFGTDFNVLLVVDPNDRNDYRGLDTNNKQVDLRWLGHLNMNEAMQIELQFKLTPHSVSTGSEMEFNDTTESTLVEKIRHKGSLDFTNIFRILKTSYTI